MMETEIAVKSALASALNFSDISLIRNNDNLRTDLQLDSMSSLMFLMKLEENIDGFHVDPDTLQLSDLETVSTVVSYVDTQLYSENEYVY